MSQVYFEDLEAGDEVEPLPKTPSREQIREYASLSTLRQGRFSSDDDAKGEVKSLPDWQIQHLTGEPDERHGDEQ